MAEPITTTTKKGECFRVYEDARDSYHDHSLFLKQDRYASLFDLRIDDYKGWAKGLKRCGYATSPTYAKALIELIERHGLDQYDDEGIQWIKRGGMPSPSRMSWTRPERDSRARPTGQSASAGRGPAASPNNDVAWIQGLTGESLYDLAAAYQLSVWQLRKYNDLKGADGSTVLDHDRRLYTQPKRRRGVRDWHVVEEGETLRTISDAEAVKLKVLVDRTDKGPDQTLPVGYKVPLRFPPREDGSLPGTPVWGAGAEPVPR